MQKPFEGILGNSTELRLLEYLMPLAGIEFNITELAEETGVSRPTITRIVKNFVKQGILFARAGQIVQYSTNPDSPIVKTMEQLNNVIIESMLGEEVLTEIGEYWAMQNVVSKTVPGYGTPGILLNAVDTPYQIKNTSNQEENRYYTYNEKISTELMGESSETGFLEPIKQGQKRFMRLMATGSET